MTLSFQFRQLFLKLFNKRPNSFRSLSEVDRKEVKAQNIVSSTGSSWILDCYFESLSKIYQTKEQSFFIYQRKWYKNIASSIEQTFKKILWTRRAQSWETCRDFSIERLTFFAQCPKRTYKVWFIQKKKHFPQNVPLNTHNAVLTLQVKFFHRKAEKNHLNLRWWWTREFFWGKKFNESFHRNIWIAVLTCLLKIFTTETETLWLNVRRSKKNKMFSKSPSSKCGLVEHNFDNPAHLYLPRGKKISLNVWNR